MTLAEVFTVSTSFLTCVMQMTTVTPGPLRALSDEGADAPQTG